MKTTDLTLCGLLSACLCISAFFTIPLPFTPVPVTFQVMVLCITGAVLGGRRAAAAAAIYLFLGGIGLPVFSGMKGGIGALAGPTGGFIFGFIPAAFVIGTLIEKWVREQKNRTILLRNYIICMECGLIVLYTFGTVQFMFLTHASLHSALFATVIPFVPMDFMKVFAAALLACALKRHRISL